MPPAPDPETDAAAPLLAALDNLDELESVELTVAGGDTVRIVSLAEVRDWLEGWVARARAGALARPDEAG